MIASLIQASPAERPFNRKLMLTGLFWTFSYVLLTIRGAIFHDDWGRLLDDNRILAVTVGAAAYGLVLRQLDAGHKISLRGAMAWIAGATLAVMVVRLTLDELMFDVPQGAGVNLLWSLTWSAYFGLWVMGSLAFAPGAVTAPATPVEAEAAAKPADIDDFETLIAVILDEAAGLRPINRAKLAARVAALGGYEAADGLSRDNERARLALRLAARISEQP